MAAGSVATPTTSVTSATGWWAPEAIGATGVLRDIEDGQPVGEASAQRVVVAGLGGGLTVALGGTGRADRGPARPEGDRRHREDPRKVGVVGRDPPDGDPGRSHDVRRPVQDEQWQFEDLEAEGSGRFGERRSRLDHPFDGFRDPQAALTGEDRLDVVGVDRLGETEAGPGVQREAATWDEQRERPHRLGARAGARNRVVVALEASQQRRIRGSGRHGVMVADQARRTLSAEAPTRRLAPCETRHSRRLRLGGLSRARAPVRLRRDESRHAPYAPLYVSAGCRAGQVVYLGVRLAS